MSVDLYDGESPDQRKQRLMAEARSRRENGDHDVSHTEALDEPMPDGPQGQGAPAERVVMVLRALDDEGGHVEHSAGRCLSVLAVKMGHVMPSSQLGDAVREAERRGYIDRDVRGTKTRSIDLTESGLAYLEAQPATFGMLPGVGERRCPPVPPPAPPKREQPMREVTNRAPLAGGKRAPTIMVVRSDPPAKPIKLAPIDPIEALDTGGVLDALQQEPGVWYQVLTFPTKRGAFTCQKRWLEADPPIACLQHDDGGFELHAATTEDTSALWMRWIPVITG